MDDDEKQHLLPGFVENFVPSAIKAGAGLYDAATHPGRTTDALLNVYSGTLAKAGIDPTALSEAIRPPFFAPNPRTEYVKSLPAEQLKQRRQAQIEQADAAYQGMINKWGIEHDTKTGKWGFNPGTLSKSFNEDPVPLLLDAAPILPKGSSALLKGADYAANAAKSASRVGKTGQAATWSTIAPALTAAGKAVDLTGRAVDPMTPINGAVLAAKQFGKPIIKGTGNVLASVQGRLADLDQEFFKKAFAAGRNSERTPNGKAQKQAFLGSVTGGNAAIDKLYNIAQNIAEQYKKKVVTNYLNDINSIGHKPVDYTNLNDEIQKVRSEIQTFPVGTYSKLEKAVEKAQNRLDDFRTHPNTMTRTIKGADKLRKSLGKILDKLDGNEKGMFGNIYGAAKQTASDVDPKYGIFIDKYKHDIEHAEDLGKMTQDKQSFMQNLPRIVNGTDAPYMDILSQYDPHFPSKALGLGFQRLIPENPLPAILTPGVLQKAGTVVAGSPRLGGTFNFNLGQTAEKAGRVLKPVGELLKTRTPTSALVGADVVNSIPKTMSNEEMHVLTEGQGSMDEPDNTSSLPSSSNPETLTNEQMQELLSSDSDNEEEKPPQPPLSSPQSQFAGGRVGRATGGKVQEIRRHEYLVNRLLRAAKHAKKETNKATEPLLDLPDNQIVKALEVAQRAI